MLAQVDMERVLIMPWAIPVIFGCAVAMISILAKMVSYCWKYHCDTRLKRSMIERGYSVADIERVLNSGQRSYRSDDYAVDDDDSKPPVGRPRNHRIFFLTNSLDLER